jgi:hypothetical protein
MSRKTSDLIPDSIEDALKEIKQLRNSLNNHLNPDDKIFLLDVECKQGDLTLSLNASGDCSGLLLPCKKPAARTPAVHKPASPRPKRRSGQEIRFNFKIPQEFLDNVIASSLIPTEPGSKRTRSGYETVKRRFESASSIELE